MVLDPPEWKTLASSDARGGISFSSATRSKDQRDWGEIKRGRNQDRTSLRFAKGMVKKDELGNALSEGLHK